MREHDFFYLRGQKTNWRRRIWNEISERVKDRTHARVLYLSAVADKDRACAVSKGFNPNNLIAVDIDKDVVSKIRHEGKIAVHGNLLDVISAWPASSPISVVVADMMSGFSQTVISLIVELWYSGATTEDTVVVINMLRGRDGKVGMEVIENHREACGTQDTHRGRAVTRCHIAEVLFLYAESKGMHVNQLTEAEGDLCSRWVLQRIAPKYDTYRSAAGNQRFDTIIYNNNAINIKQKTSLLRLKDISQKYPQVAKARLSIRAALAVQSARNSGTLSPAPRW